MCMQKCTILVTIIASSPDDNREDEFVQLSSKQKAFPVSNSSGYKLCHSCDDFTKRENGKIRKASHYHCDKCTKRFDRHSRLYSHIRLEHSMNKPTKVSTKSSSTHVCPICSNKFKTLNSLNNHMNRYHAGEVKTLQVVPVDTSLGLYLVRSIPGTGKPF